MQISDTAAVKTGLACSKTNTTVSIWFAVGNKVVSKIKATYGKEGEYCRFLEARGVERTLSEGAVEQYPRRRQRVYMLRPRTCYFHRSDLHACTRKRQAKRPCLGTEEAAEDDGCSSAARRR